MMNANWFQIAMLAYNLNCWLQLFHREENTTVEAIKHSRLATARLRFLFLAASTPLMTFVPNGSELRSMLNRAHERGQQVPPLSEVLDHLLAPLYFHALFGAPGNGAFTAGLVDHLLRSYRTEPDRGARLVRQQSS
jgi:hypothetical protein